MTIGLALAAVLIVLKLLGYIHLSWLWIVAAALLEVWMFLLLVLGVAIAGLLGFGGVLGWAQVTSWIQARRFRRYNKARMAARRTRPTLREADF